MRVAAAQMNIVWEDKRANMTCCERLAEKAAGKCKLVVFPELSVTGFSMNPKLAEPPDGDTAEFFCGLSERYGLSAAFGFAAEVGGRIYNRMCIASGGRISASYDKIHPFSYGGESEVFSAGDEAVTAEIDGVRFGLSICYDLRFPALFQKLSYDCDCIINIASWPEKRRGHWRTLLNARAVESQSYVIGCNRTGEGGALSYIGDSMVISPEGDVIAEAKPYSEELCIAEISAERVREYRKDFPTAKDRRNDLYKQFL